VGEEEAKLVSAAVGGDNDAFEELVVRHQRKAVAVAGRLLGNVDDSLEVVQEAFVRAYRSLGELNDRRRFGAWFMRIVVNQALNLRQSRRRRATVGLAGLSGAGGAAGEGPVAMEPAAKTPSPQEQLAAKELAEALKKAIDELPERLRTALLLFSVEGLAQKEVAGIMDCSVETVKWRVFEARRRLRKRLGKML